MRAERGELASGPLEEDTSKLSELDFGGKECGFGERRGIGFGEKKKTKCVINEKKTLCFFQKKGRGLSEKGVLTKLKGVFN